MQFHTGPATLPCMKKILSSGHEQYSVMYYRIYIEIINTLLFLLNISHMYTSRWFSGYPDNVYSVTSRIP